MTKLALATGFASAAAAALIVTNTATADQDDQQRPSPSPAMEAASLPGVANARRAKMNFALNCQGCHMASGAGTPERVPSMAGAVARFLHTPGGREYLVRVPGMTNAAISDEALAELANWTLYTFDREHVPADFKPYSAQEVQIHRQSPLIGDAEAERNRLLQALASVTESSAEIERTASDSN